MAKLSQRNKRNGPRNSSNLSVSFQIKEDKKGQEKMFSHPFQAQPSTSSASEIEPTKPSKKINNKASKHIIPEPMDSDTKRKQTAKKSHITRLRHPDLLKLQDATCLFPTISIKLCWKGVTKAMYNQDYIFQSIKISRYSCMLYLPKNANTKCNYQTSNAGQMGTHIH